MLITIPQSRRVAEEEATGDVPRHYTADRADLGHVAGHTSAMVLDPEALDAFEVPTQAVAAQLSPRRCAPGAALGTAGTPA